MIGYDEPLTRPFDISMERGEKVVLKGSNGIGKTTLLKSILGPVSYTHLATFSLKELPYEGGFTVKDTRHLILSSDPGLGIKCLKKEMLA